MKVFELRKKKGSVSSVYAIALVEDPAIEIGFVALSKNQPIPQVKLSINEEKRMIYTPVLIPEQRILRKGEDGQPYQIYFTAETIWETSHDFHQAKLTDNFNSEHISSKRLDGVNVVENWIIKDADNGDHVKLGFKGLPEGTWMMGIKINSDSTWKEVKAGKYKGISIEGIFEDYEIKATKTKLNINKNEIQMKKQKGLAVLLSSIASLLNPKLASQTLVDGTIIYYEGDLGEGTSVFADEAMETPVPDGSYEVSENQIITVENGVVTLVEEVEMKKEGDEELSAAVEQLAKTTLSLIEKHKEQTKEIAELKKVQAEHVAKLAKVSAVSSKTAVKLASESMEEELKTLSKFK